MIYCKRKKTKQESPPPQKNPQTNKTENKKQNKALLLTLFMNEYSKLGPPTVKNCM